MKEVRGKLGERKRREEEVIVIGRRGKPSRGEGERDNGGH